MLKRFKLSDSKIAHDPTMERIGLKRLTVSAKIVASSAVQSTKDSRPEK